MECMNKCGKQAAGKGKYCSASCKTLYNRNKSVTNVTAGSVTNPTVTTERIAVDFEQQCMSSSAVKSAPTTVHYPKPHNYGQPDCECQHCQTVRANKSKHTLNHGAWKPALEFDKNELNRVSLPGDVDYEGCSVPVKTSIKASVALLRPIKTSVSKFIPIVVNINPGADCDEE